LPRADVAVIHSDIAAGGDEGDEDPINDPGFLETIKITVLQVS